MYRLYRVFIDIDPDITFFVALFNNTNIQMEVFKGHIGIDLGTTYSCVSFWDGDHVVVIPNRSGNRTTPSYVAYTDTEILVGEAAKEQVGRNPENTLYNIKRILGKRYSDDSVQADLEHFPFEITSDINDVPTISVTYKGERRLFKPEQVSAQILEYMRKIAEDYLGQKVRTAVITVPAYFNDSQRTSTKNAAAIAGLECVSIINEPTAACLCYGLDKKEDNSKVLIFDLGGGTFDVSILNLCGGIFEVLSTSGDTHLGGEDFDATVAENLLREFIKRYKLSDKISLNHKSYRKLLNAAEKAKRTLSETQQVDIEIENFYDGKDLFYKLTRTKFETWCLPLFTKCLEPVKKALEDAQLESMQIRDVVLVGGSTRIPKVQELLAQFFNQDRTEPIVLNKSVHPDEAVAYGAAVQGAILSKSDSSGRTKDLLLMDVTPLSLGVESHGGQMSFIIERNAQVPIKKSRVYSTVEDGQQSVLIKILQGERSFAKDNHPLGTFELTDIPRQPKGVPKIEVQFSLDANGILSVRAIDKDTCNYNEIVVSNSTSLTREQINEMIAEAEEFRADDALRKEALTLRHQFEKELTHAQQTINNEELTTDSDGNVIVTDEEISWLNQYILSNLTWLEDNEDLSKTKIEEVKNLFMKNSKPIMIKIYARKKQIDLARKYVDEDEKELGTEDIQRTVNSIFGALETPDSGAVLSTDAYQNPKKVVVKCKPKMKV